MTTALTMGKGKGRVCDLNSLSKSVKGFGINFETEIYEAMSNYTIQNNMNKSQYLKQLVLKDLRSKGVIV